MNRCRFFIEKELRQVREAVSISEDLVSDYYKMSSAQWIRSRYDVRTAKDLETHEQVDGPFAQVVGYCGQKNNVSLGSGRYNFYRICIQDGAILDLVKDGEQIALFPFLLYVVVHELVHIVRFSRFQQIYEAASEADCALEEERIVHGITREILKGVSVDGVGQVFVYYEKWIHGDTV